MPEIIIGSVLATALLYIGKCWGAQGRTYHVTLFPDRNRRR
jgi:hypothetical protein